ncbi:uncharacterized protein [Ptychodera flava]|uniref:uncharacterized protein n=1 Tax=Ptychodera flava TaxID=63121 RepID=UPI00396A0A35
MESQIEKLLKKLDPTYDELIKDLEEIGKLMASSLSGNFCDSIMDIADAAESKSKDVLWSVLDLIKQLKSFRKQARKCLQFLIDRLDFTDMDINTFMKKYDLSSSGCERIFEDNNIAYANELLQFKILNDELKLVLKPRSFKRLKSKLSKAGKVKNYLENEMEKELSQAGAQIKESSSSLTNELVKLRQYLINVELELEKVIDDEKKRAKMRKLAWDGLGIVGLGLTFYSGVGLITAVIRCSGKAVISKGLQWLAVE